MLIAAPLYCTEPRLREVSKRDLADFKMLLTEHLETIEKTPQHRELKSFFSYPKIPNKPVDKKLSFSSGSYTITFTYEHTSRPTMKGKLDTDHIEKVSVLISAKGRELTPEEQRLVERYNFEFVDPNREIIRGSLVKARMSQNPAEGMKVEFSYVTGPDEGYIAFPRHGYSPVEPLNEDIIRLSFSCPPMLSDLSDERRNRWLDSLDRSL